MSRWSDFWRSVFVAPPPSGSVEQRGISSIEDYIQMLNTFYYEGNPYYLTGQSVHQTIKGHPAESIANSLEAYAQQAMNVNGAVFACMATRMYVFSAIRFQFQRLKKGRPGDLFSTAALQLLDRPWPGGTTQDLLIRMIQDADLCGNSYWVRQEDELVHLRPDWVSILLEPRALYPKGQDPRAVQPDAMLGYRRIGYMYQQGGAQANNDPVFLGPEEVAHFAPIPDPLASYRGMSPMTPVLREIKTDGQMMQHKSKYLEQGASPNMVVSLPKEVTYETFRKFKEDMERSTAGTQNAYKTLYLAGGADVEVVGSDFKQMDFKNVQGHGEPLALDTPIPTPTSWTTMGEIRPGDKVLGRDGRPANVVKVAPVHYDRPCYRVSFKDGSSIVADGGHRWVATDRSLKGRPEKVYTTNEIKALIDKPYANGAGGYRVAVPLSPRLDLEPIDLLIDPYVLGAWLGDGQTAGAAVCGAPDDLEFISGEFEAAGYTTTKWKTAEGKVDVIGMPGGMLAALRAVGVFANKHIPADYLRASYAQRLSLLQGLMDTDGSVGHSGVGNCEFSSKDEHLARQAAELARTLGYRVTVSRKTESRSSTGATWRVFFRSDPSAIPFRLPRKVARCEEAGAPKVQSRSIVSVEPVASVPVRCIAVDTKDHLFLAGEGLVPTHNTRIAAAFGVPPVIVGLSEGLEAATYSNYAQARRRFADGTLHPLWVNACGSLAPILPNPSEGSSSGDGDLKAPRKSKKSSSSGYRLWYDDRDVPFLREDRKDAADIQNKQSESIRTLVDAGFEPESVRDAVVAEDFNELTHSGLFSIQLQPPGSMMGGMPGMPSSSSGTGGTSPMKNPLPTSGQGFGEPGPPDKQGGQQGGQNKPSKSDSGSNKKSRMELVGHDEATGVQWWQRVMDNDVDTVEVEDRDDIEDAEVIDEF